MTPPPPQLLVASHRSLSLHILLTIITLAVVLPSQHLHVVSAYTNHHNNLHTSSSSSSEWSFDLGAYQTARALETFHQLDATRLHFQILLVDDDNAKARIAEGLVAKIAEYNDAMVVLFPASATIANAYNAPRDAAPEASTLQVCASLQLCPVRSEEIGTAFDLNCLDQYDLIIAMDDDIRSLILRSLPSTSDELYYAPKCRTLSEFLSWDFCGSLRPQQTLNRSKGKTTTKRSSRNNGGAESLLLLDMMEPNLRDRVTPFASVFANNNNGVHTDDVFRNAKIPKNLPPQSYSVPRMILNEHGAAVPLLQSWPLVEAALILATTGLVRFCLDAMDQQLQRHFQTLLKRNIWQSQHLTVPWPKVDEQLNRCNASVCGYFSPQQRKDQFDRHYVQLKQKLIWDRHRVHLKHKSILQQQQRQLKHQQQSDN